MNLPTKTFLYGVLLWSMAAPSRPRAQAPALGQERLQDGPVLTVTDFKNKRHEVSGAYIEYVVTTALGYFPDPERSGIALAQGAGIVIRPWSDIREIAVVKKAGKRTRPVVKVVFADSTTATTELERGLLYGRFLSGAPPFLAMTDVKGIQVVSAPAAVVKDRPTVPDVRLVDDVGAEHLLTRVRVPGYSETTETPCAFSSCAMSCDSLSVAAFDTP